MDPKVLHDAVRGNNVAEVKLLISCGADVNMKGQYGWTALHLAAYENKVDSHFEVIELLLKSGADVNALDDLGKTPIFNLVVHSDFKTVKLLLDFGADLKVKDKNNSTLLIPAVFNTTGEIVRLLVEHGADAGHIIRDSYSIFHCALGGRPTEVFQMVKCLIQNGADIDLCDDDTCPPLAGALQLGSVPLLRFFCKYADFSSISSHEYVQLKNIKNKDTWMTLLKHLAKLKTLNLMVSPTFCQEISKKRKFSVYFEKCTKELVGAKSIKLKNSWVTYFNLLVGSKRKLKNYAGNRDLIGDFKNSNCIEKFPIYGPEMQKNVEKGLKTRKVFDESAVALSNTLTIFNPTHLIIRDILDCLTHKDYVLFLSAV